MVGKAIKAGVSPRKGMAMGMYPSGAGSTGGGRTGSASTSSKPAPKPMPKPKGGKGY